MLLPNSIVPSEQSWQNVEKGLLNGKFEGHCKSLKHKEVILNCPDNEFSLPFYTPFYVKSYTKYGVFLFNEFIDANPIIHFPLKSTPYFVVSILKLLGDGVEKIYEVL